MSLSNAHLLRIVPLQSELPGRFAACKLAAIEVHTPGATKRERGTGGLWVQTLTCTGTTNRRDEEDEVSYSAIIYYIIELAGDAIIQQKMTLFQDIKIIAKS